MKEDNTKNKKPFPKYEKDKDYCGGKGMSCLVPDTLWGIDVSYVCYLHDKNYYEAIVSRKDADILFRDRLYHTLRSGGMWRIRAWWRSRIYYRFVRRFGSSHYDKDE